MKKIFYSAASVVLLPVLGLLYACDEEPFIPEENNNLGEIICDREVVGQDQVFTLTCPVTQTVYLDHVSFTWTEMGKVMPSHFDVGKSFVTPDLVWAGNHTYTLTQNGETSDGRAYQESRSFQLEVIPTDIRNHFWGDNKETCKKDLKRYPIRDFEETENQFSFKEDNSYHYYTEINGKAYLAEFTDGDKRTTQFFFSEDGKLNSIEYLASIFIGSDKLMIADFVNYAEKLKEYEKLDSLTPDYILVAGATLSTEEQRLADAFAAGRLTADPTGTLAKAVKENRLKLTYRGQSRTLLFDMICFYSVDDYTQLQTYQPLLY